jgi:hypothetical protein
VPAQPLTAPLPELLAPLGQTGYLATAQQLGLAESLPGFPSQPGRLPDFEADDTVRDLTVTPMHLVRIVAALAQNGQLPKPILALSSVPEQTQGFRSGTAQAVRRQLPQVAEELVGWASQASPEETGRQSLSWFVGLAPASTQSNSPPSASAALSEEGLILDPTQIEAVTPTPAPATTAQTARYAVVAVVVTDQPAEEPALRLARAPLNVLLVDGNSP